MSSLLFSASVFLSTASVTEATMTSSLKPTWPTWKICGVGLSGFSFGFFLWFVCLLLDFYAELKRFFWQENVSLLTYFYKNCY